MELAIEQDWDGITVMESGIFYTVFCCRYAGKYTKSCRGGNENSETRHAIPVTSYTRKWNGDEDIATDCPKYLERTKINGGK